MVLHHDLSAYDVEDRTYSIDEWLALEARTGKRYEYHEGRLLPFEMMAGGTFEHSVIGANVVTALGRRLHDLGLPVRCRTCSSDLKIKIPGTNRYLLPDAAVVCGAPEFDARVKTAIRKPTVVVEVLSESSERYDPTRKFEYYSALPTLRHYVLVSQDEAHVEVRTRREGEDSWRFEYDYGTEATIALPAVGLEVGTGEVYFGVAFEGGEVIGDLPSEGD